MSVFLSSNILKLSLFKNSMSFFLIPTLLKFAFNNCEFQYNKNTLNNFLLQEGRTEGRVQRDVQYQRFTHNLLGYSKGPGSLLRLYPLKDTQFQICFTLLLLLFLIFIPQHWHLQNATLCQLDCVFSNLSLALMVLTNLNLFSWTLKSWGFNCYWSWNVTNDFSWSFTVSTVWCSLLVVHAFKTRTIWTTHPIPCSAASMRYIHLGHLWNTAFLCWYKKTLPKRFQALNAAGLFLIITGFLTETDQQRKGFTLLVLVSN